MYRFRFTEVDSVHWLVQCALLSRSNKMSVLFLRMRVTLNMSLNCIPSALLHEKMNGILRGTTKHATTLARYWTHHHCHQNYNAVRNGGTCLRLAHIPCMFSGKYHSQNHPIKCEHLTQQNQKQSQQQHPDQLSEPKNQQQPNHEHHFQLPQDDKQVLYMSPLAVPVRILKRVSIGSSILTIMAIPLFIGSGSATAGVAGATAISVACASFSLLSTALITKLTKNYIIRIVQGESGTQATIETLNLFGKIKKQQIEIDDLHDTPAEGKGFTFGNVHTHRKPQRTFMVHEQYFGHPKLEHVFVEWRKQQEEEECANKKQSDSEKKEQIDEQKSDLTKANN